ncbi:MAG: hypothetical protein LWX09_02840 [Bacteroidia bacterium]|nr:hypothetical protein [Bacteroidia bacterium]
METGLQQNFNERTSRPALLTFLCILSFIGSGLSAVSGFFVFINHQVILEMLTEEVLEQFGMPLQTFFSVPRQYFLIVALLNVVSFVGVRFMWRLRRPGFHLYAISQLLIIIVSTVFIYKPAGVFPGFDLMLTTLFILLYLRFREVMS